MEKFKITALNKSIVLIAACHLFLLGFVLFFYTNVAILDIENLIAVNQKAYPILEKELLVFCFIILLSAILCVYYVNKFLLYPISLILKSLETGNKSSIKLLKNSKDEFKYIGELFQDNENQKYSLVSAKTKAEESERLKTIFLENLSHEIRTPMNAIIGFTNLLLTDQLSENDKKEYLSIIHHSGTNLVSIIEDLIEMSKIDSNQITPNYTNINLEKCLFELFDTINVNIPKDKNIELKINESTTRLFYNVKVDEVKLKQIFTNLINNAIKFTNAGHVAFGYEIIEEGELAFIKFIVEDTGIGISKEDQKTIFERFKQVESDLTIETGGLGLGLSISKAYVEMMGGTISIQSAETEGTTISFTIPLKYDKIVKEIIINEKPSKIEFSAINKTILIAEDDNINFMLIKKMLQVTNYDIIRAENGQIAIDKFIENPLIDLVLMDIKMPVMNGYEAFEEINKLKPELPIVAQTAHASEEDKEKILSMGFANYITKPINKELLIEMVENHLKV